MKVLKGLAALALGLPTGALACGVGGEQTEETLAAEGYERRDGLFTLYVDPRADEDDAFGPSVCLSVRQDQLGREFIVNAQPDGGVYRLAPGVPQFDRGAIARFERRGGTVQLVLSNTKAAWDEDNPLTRRKSVTTGDTIAARYRPQGTVVLPPSSEAEEGAEPPIAYLFSAQNVMGGFDLTMDGYSDDVGSSGAGVVIGADNFETNTDLLIERSYRLRGGDASATSQVARGGGSRRVAWRMSMIALPGEGFAPRAADARVGYFTVWSEDPTRFGPVARTELIRRWRLRKETPGAALSKPVRPIVFWIENTTPQPLRAAVREGVLSWNAAFEAAGFREAIEVRQMPDDAGWDPTDIRYNVLRWVVREDEALMGQGPSIHDPRTGEILAADIYLGFDALAGREGNPLGAADLIRTGGLGAAWDGREPTKAVLDLVRTTVVHEVGHTLGLRHNFMGSAGSSLAEHERAARQGGAMVASVMDYTPPLLPLPGDPAFAQRSQSGPGPYDVWAIQYGYTEEGEGGALDDLLRRASREPALAYGADGRVTFPGAFVDADPRVQAWDATSEPAAYAWRTARATDALLDEVTAARAQGLVRGDAVNANVFALMAMKTQALVSAALHVGGVHADPLLPGSEGGALFRAVTEEDQREALDAILALAFARGAYEAEGAVLRYVEPADLTQDTRYRADLGGVARERQAHLLDHLTSEPVLERMDGGFYGGTYTAQDMLLDLNEGIIGQDLTGTPSPIRRAAQIAYVERLTGLLDYGEGAPRTAALAALRDVRGRMGLTDLLMRPEAKAHRGVIGRLLGEAGV